MGQLLCSSAGTTTCRLSDVCWCPSAPSVWPAGCWSVLAIIVAASTDELSMENISVLCWHFWASSVALVDVVGSSWPRSCGSRERRRPLCRLDELWRARSMHSGWSQQHRHTSRCLGRARCRAGGGFSSALPDLRELGVSGRTEASEGCEQVQAELPAADGSATDTLRRLHECAPPIGHL